MRRQKKQIWVWNDTWEDLHSLKGACPKKSLMDIIDEAIKDKVPRKKNEKFFPRI